MKCISCKKTVKKLHFEKTLYKEGTEIIINAGYGSVLDGIQFKGVICDLCNSDLFKEDVLKFVKEHSYPDTTVTQLKRELKKVVK